MVHITYIKVRQSTVYTIILMATTNSLFNIINEDNTKIKSLDEINTLCSNHHFGLNILFLILGVLRPLF